LLSELRDKKAWSKKWRQGVAKEGFRIMDSDLHVIEPDDMYQSYLEEPLKTRAPRKVRSHVSALEKWVVDGHSTPHWIDLPQIIEANSQLMARKERAPLQQRAYERNFDASSTLKAMDLEGVDVAILYRTIGGMIGQAMDRLAPDFSAALCRAYNNWLGDYCKTDPARLKAVAVVSLQDVDQAVAEARRTVTELGFVGVSIHPDPVKGRLLYDREVDPLWAEIEKLNVAVGIHGTSTGMAHDDIALKFLYHPAGRVVQRSLVFPLQLMTSMAGILVSGVCERFPTLRIAFLEGNCSWLPWFLFRIDEQWEKHGAIGLDRPPSEYFRRNCYISVDVDEYLVEDVIRRLGDDNLVLSTDYPHYDSSFPEAVDTFLKLDLREETRRKILWDNCARLYGMG
jgi:predicted TIM-barrel fold metal-dependent hydrolase